MISRLFRAVPFAVAAATVALLSPACQRVPLLAPSGSSITLTAAANALPLNGSTDIIAQVLESGGTPPQDGTHITFTTTLGSFQPSEASTKGGRVTVKFLAGNQNGNAIISASSGGASASGNNALKIAIGSAAVGRVTIDANPGTVSANGGTSTITSVVFDVNGNPLGGVQVAFSTDAGTVSPSVVAADANGVAQSTLTTNKTAKVTATAGNPATGGGGTGTGTTTPTSAQTATVTVSVNAPSSISFGTITPSTPVAGQAVVFALTYGTATGVSPIVRVIVDWGDGSGAQTVSGQPTAISHTFRSPGSFLVVATATDSFGDPSTATTAVTVTPQARPTVTITASANPVAGVPVTFTIAATPPTGAAITSVTVDYGDGQRNTLPGNATSVQHIYATGGTYTATAVATDSNNNSGSGSTVIFVGNVTVVLSSTQSTGHFTNVTFTATVQPSSVNVSSFRWDFGDGSAPETTTSNTNTHAYTPGSGQKTATVTVTTTSGQTATASTVITP